MKKTIATFALLPTTLWAVNATEPPNNLSEPQTQVAKPVKAEAHLPTLDSPANKRSVLPPNLQHLRHDLKAVSELLSQAIYAHNPQAIAELLSYYKGFPNRNAELEQYAEGKLALLTEDYSAAIQAFERMLEKNPALNVVRIELAIAQFNQRHNRDAKANFKLAEQDTELPTPARQLIGQYIEAIHQRDRWQWSANSYYLREGNVNNASSSDEIENTGYQKGEEMKPQKAHGFGFSLGVSRDFNLYKSHYLTVSSDLYGSIYWDNHEYDDLTNRNYVGYAYKNAKTSVKLLPFWERRWSGNTSYRWSNGVRGELAHWFTPNWQLALAAEYGKLRYFDSTAQNGHHKLISSTLFWARKAEQSFYVGTDFSRENTRVRQFSADTLSLRTGWQQSWGKGIMTNLNFSFSRRHYKDVAYLGGFLNLKKIRKDKAYRSSLTLWKQDWSLWGITPKLQFSYSKHDSNLPTMYSFTDKKVNILLDADF